MIQDKNISSVKYDETNQQMTVLYSQSVWRYAPVTPEEFDYIMEEQTAKSVLDLLHNNLDVVGIRLR